MECINLNLNFKHTNPTIFNSFMYFTQAKYNQYLYQYASKEALYNSIVVLKVA